MSPQDKDKFDRWLDTALRQYGNAEARAGLEARILANLKTAGSPAASRTGWMWALSMAVATAAAICFLWFAGRSQPDQHRQNEAHNAAHPVFHVANQDVPRQRPSSWEPKHMKQIVGATERQLAAAPLGQFPSPRPANAQELVLAEYVKRFPNEALL